MRHILQATPLRNSVARGNSMYKLISYRKGTYLFPKYCRRVII